MDNLHLDQHISQQFNVELENIKARMLHMGGLVETQLREAITALTQLDTALAEAVLAREDEVDRLEMEIDEACTTIIARRQPAASDLRMVLAVLKSIRDMERIGDEAAKVAKMAVTLAENSPGGQGEGFVEIRHIGDAVASILAKTLDAFARYDSDSALEALQMDEQIDRDYKSALRELITYMMEDPRSIGRVLNIIWAVRSLERIGDHAKNICEHIIYLVRGKDIRHGQLQTDEF